jgi:hypothetical protein
MGKKPPSSISQYNQAPGSTVGRMMKETRKLFMEMILKTRFILPYSILFISAPSSYIYYPQQLYNILL